MVLVASTGHALLVERAFLQAELACKLISVPRQLSSDCGVCVRIDPNEQTEALSVCAEKGVEIEGIHLIEL